MPLILRHGSLFLKFERLRRFGLKLKYFVNIAIRLHENSLINVKIGEGDSEVASSIGVRQSSSCEGPILLLC